MMMEGKSLLNPYATPYVPISKISVGKSFASESEGAADVLGHSENEVIEKVAEFQLSDTFPLEYDIQSLETHVSDESSSKTSDPCNSYNGPLRYEFISTDDESVLDEPNLIIESLSMMYPNISMDSLAELVMANNGDLNQTIDALDQLEFEGDEFEQPSETSKTSDSSGSASHKVPATEPSNSL